MIASSDTGPPVSVFRRMISRWEHVGVALMEMKNAKDVLKERRTK